MDLFWCSFLVLLGAIIQTVFGFGMAIVAAPLLIMIEPRLVPGPLVFAAMVQCILMAHQNRRDLDPAGLTSAFIGRIPGSIAGAFILTLVSTPILSIGVGVVVLIAVAFSLGRFKILPTPVSMFWASMVSGFLGSATSIGGPPMALLMQHEQAGKIRANLAGYFIYGCVITLISLYIIGRFGMEELMLSLWLVPGAVLGFVVCRWLPFYRLGDNLRPAILGICVVSALFAIVRGGLM